MDSYASRPRILGSHEAVARIEGQDSLTGSVASHILGISQDLSGEGKKCTLHGVSTDDPDVSLLCQTGIVAARRRFRE